MKKILLRIAALLIIFIAACVFFYLRLDIHTYDAEVIEVSEQGSKLPIVSFMVNNNEINLSKGYTVNRDSLAPRDSITPLSLEQSFDILVVEGAEAVKKMEVEVLSVPSLMSIYQTTANSVAVNDSGRIDLPVKIEGTLTENTEYLLRVTLITAEGNHIYYYTRIQVSTFGSLSGSMEFVNNFHVKTFDKEDVYELIDVMEEDEDTIINDYSKINISSNMDALSYGELAPTEIARLVPTITEYNEKYASVKIKYWLNAYSNDGLEEYECEEDFRFLYSSYRIFLYNYDRTMQTVFDGKSFVIGESELKLGITNDPTVDYLYSEDKNQLIFEYQGDVWHLNIKENTLDKVYSFDSDDYDRALTKDYDYTLLNIDEKGNADFAVYGYIGKGEYEGRVGIIYYHYYADDNRLLEKMFIPANVSFTELTDEFAKVRYTTETDIFYFTLFDGYYSYELNTNVLKTEVEDLGDSWLYFEEEGLLCFNENQAVGENERVVILDIYTNERTYIDADEGQVINLLSTVDNRLVIGMGDKANLSYYNTGEYFLPYTKLQIVELDRTVVETYVPEDEKYIGKVAFAEGIIKIDLYTLDAPAEGDKLAKLSFYDKDVIINLNKTVQKVVSTSSKINEKTRKEYYFDLPSSYKPDVLPEIESANFTVLKKDTTVSIRPRETKNYSVWKFGQRILETDELGEAIHYANENLATVMSKDGMVVWQRGVVKEEAVLEGITISYANDSRDKEQAVLQMLADYKGINLDATECDMAVKPLLSWLKESVSPSAAMVRNATIEEVLYFVSDGNPVIASYNNYYVVITAYDDTRITYMDPYSGEKGKLSYEKAEDAFSKAGGIYFVITK